MRHILNPLIDTLEQGQHVILCAIVRSYGSAPRSTGARMLVLEDGTLVGSVGGGALEGSCQAKAVELFRGGSSFAELNFQLNAESAAEAGMACGGSVSVLLHRVGTDQLPLLQKTRDAYCAGEKPMLLTFLPKIDQPPRLLLFTPDKIDIPIELRAELLRKNRRLPFFIEYQADQIFVEPLNPPGAVYLAGAGHVGLATAKIAAFVGFEVVVMDDRREFANPDRYPEAREVRVIPSFNNCLDRLGPEDYVVIATRGHMHDRDVLAKALRTDAGYIGMIGSLRKRDAVYASLVGEGFTYADLERVHCPIGLAIGAETPEEIALSIVAELVRIRAGMNG